MANLFGQALFSCISVIGYSFIVNLPRKSVMGVSLFGMIGYMVYYVIQNNFKFLNTNLQQAIASFVGVFIITICCMALAKRQHLPLTVLIIPGIIAFAPGEQAYLMVQDLMLNKTNSGFEWFMQVIMIAIAIVGAISCAYVVKEIYATLVVKN